MLLASTALEPMLSDLRLHVGIQPVCQPSRSLPSAAEQLLKPPLGRGTLLCVGAATAWEVHRAALVSTGAWPSLQLA